MACEKVFWQDPYLIQLDSKITFVKGNKIKLDRTIFYPFSGGQQSDSGTIGEYKVINAVKECKEIIYEIEENHDLKEKDTVQVKIDWDKRYRLMKLHFAAELVLELIYQNYNHPQKIGANITEDKARVDFNWSGNISQSFSFLNGKLKEIIQQDLPIISDFSDRVNEIRFWEIKGFAKVPCGGTHLKRTGEIGHIELKRSNLGKGKERIELYLK